MDDLHRHRKRFEEKRNYYVKNLLNEKLAASQLQSLSFSQNPLLKDLIKSVDYEADIAEELHKTTEKRVRKKRFEFRKSEHNSVHNDNQNANIDNIDDLAPVIKSSIANEISFSKEVKHLLKRNINRDFILNHEFNMVKGQYNELFELARSNLTNPQSELDRQIILNKFRKAVRKVFIVQKMHQMHIRSMKKLQEENRKIRQYYSGEMNPAVFDKNYYSRPKEPRFPSEAKRLLQLDPEERSEDMIRYITISLNFCVPEFFSFPVNMQKRIAKFSFYQEFESPRVVIREGDVGYAFYMVISGIGSVKSSQKDINQENFIVSKPTHFLKSGDTFGEIALIYNIKRQATVSAYGDRPFGLLIIEKEDFFRIQSPISNESEKKLFLVEKVPVFKTIEYPIEKLYQVEGINIFSIYFRNGTKICEDSSSDKWLYVIKSGTCRILKKVRFDKNALSYFYREAESRRKIITNKLISLEGVEKPAQYIRDGDKFVRLPNNYLESIEYSDEEDKKTYTYLEMKKLDEGDIFGLQDLVFTEPNDLNPLVLVSDGAECILINRKAFLDNANANSSLNMKFKLPPFPNDEAFIMKYFSFLQWERFRSRFHKRVLKKIEIKNTIESLVGKEFSINYF